MLVQATEKPLAAIEVFDVTAIRKPGAQMELSRQSYASYKVIALSPLRSIPQMGSPYFHYPHQFK